MSDVTAAQLGTKQKEYLGICQRAYHTQVHQKQSHADDKLETRSGTRQHILTGVRLHERFPVRIMSVARIRTAVQTDD